VSIKTHSVLPKKYKKGGGVSVRNRTLRKKRGGKRRICDDSDTGYRYSTVTQRAKRKSKSGGNPLHQAVQVDKCNSGEKFSSKGSRAAVMGC